MYGRAGRLTVKTCGVRPGQVTSLTYAKINTIHWHLVDQQSFPFDSKSRPLLSQKGAWSAQERYSVLDVAEVVEFGRTRGVRFMVEIDGPGHAAIWCKGYPEICPSATCLEPLNPANNATFELLNDLMEDLTGGTRGTGLFPDNVIHLGGGATPPPSPLDNTQVKTNSAPLDREVPKLYPN